jgi:hypothetical protein
MARFSSRVRRYLRRRRAQGKAACANVIASSWRPTHYFDGNLCCFIVKPKEGRSLAEKGLGE